MNYIDIKKIIIFQKFILLEGYKFSKDGFNSDFWLLNSKIKNENIVYGDHSKPLTDNEKSLLTSNNIELALAPFKLNKSQNFNKPFRKML